MFSVVFALCFFTFFRCIQPLQIAFGNLPVIWHTSPTFGMLVTIVARVNRITVICIVEAHFVTVFFDFFPIEGICKRKNGHKTGADAVSIPEPGQISDFQLDGVFRTATERLLSAIITGTVAVKRSVREIGANRLEIADGIPFLCQSAIQGLFKDDKAMKVGILTFQVDNLTHETLGLYHGVEDAKIPHKNFVRTILALVAGTRNGF